MVNLNLKWYAWALILFTIYLIYKGPGTMEWAGTSSLHMVSNAGTGVIHGLNAVRRCGFPCRSG